TPIFWWRLYVKWKLEKQGKGDEFMLSICDILRLLSEDEEDRVYAVEICVRLLEFAGRGGRGSAGGGADGIARLERG
ncbi:unnamed protein product, partial [Amoebophrya sp. A25]